jgi:uncharacterized membrane protein
MQNMSGKSTFGLDANIVAGLCYVANFVCCLGLILSIITVIQDKTNKLARFHAFQSIFLAVLAIVVGIGIWVVIIVGSIIDGMLMFATGLPIPIVTILLGLIFGILGLAIFIGVIFAAIKGFQGQILKLPIIGGFADKFSG